VFAQGVGGTGAAVFAQGVGGTGAAVFAHGVGGTGAAVFAQGVGGTGAAVFAITMDFVPIAPQTTNIASKTTDFFDIRLLRGETSGGVYFKDRNAVKESFKEAHTPLRR
jgi:hypothetical protein